MKLIDLHCDTAYRLHQDSAHLFENNFHISLHKTAKYENYSQIMAIFISSALSDEEGYLRFHEIYGYLSAELAENKNRIKLITSGTSLPELWASSLAAAILSVEDARILAGDILRLEQLYKKGIRFLVLVWAGQTCIGGAHNTEAGLTEFGREVMSRCFKLGIIPDISHASAKSASEMLSIAHKYKKPLIASHSNSYSVYPHTRNLRDEHFLAVRDLGGIVGISLCRSHLGSKCTGIDDVIRHIEHYLSLGGENTIALGCDFDGTDLPDGIEDISDLVKIADRLAVCNISDEIIQNIFWGNAKTFIETHIR